MHEFGDSVFGDGDRRAAPYLHARKESLKLFHTFRALRTIQFACVYFQSLRALRHGGNYTDAGSKHTVSSTSDETATVFLQFCSNISVKTFRTHDPPPYKISGPSPCVMMT